MSLLVVYAKIHIMITGGWFMDEYILFVDETLKTPKNPYFCLSGVCFKRNYYEDVVVKEINELKKRHFENCDVIFHYSDMNNKKREFKIFKEKKVRQKFWTDYVNTVRKMNFVSFGVYFDQDKMKEIYNNGTNGIYDLTFVALLKNYLHYLLSVEGMGSICLESRSFNENAILQHSYYNYLRNGSMYFCNDSYRKHLSSLGFIIKGDNCNGLQIVDIAPSSMLREINGSYDYYGIGKMYREKLYCNNTAYQDILGFKNIL